ncbi:hypothetical protein CRUP_000095 [Coryphaenoides rupestris]|nr:hypothetical protein CRUP_000095 [Coryphaenoides rupestris]
MFLGVKVILRVCPPPLPLASDSPLRAPLLRIDPSRKRVTVVEPTWNSLTRAKLAPSRGREEKKAVFKTYTFDAAEVCSGVLSDIIRGVVGGAQDGCILGLGCVDAGG